MSEEEEETGGAGEGLTEDTVKRLIADALATRPSVRTGRGAGVPASGGETSVADQVAAEVKRIKDREQSEAKRAATDARLEELDQTVKKITQAPPRQFRRVTNWLWGDR